ncbi:hypothetical protein BDZ89DRAFT_1046348 [Hymenopellis radicata]|nr:hypothetical protein BDZ89DRAFT_1046348 [Hymenopellis radicata]
MPRLWETQITQEERTYELAYRRAVLALPFFTTATYHIPHAFTRLEHEILTASFAQFESKVRENKARAWLTNFFREWAVRFPAEPNNAKERNKSILKFYINTLATHWSGDGRPPGKDGRMDVITVRFDIVHEMVDDFEYLFPEPAQ